MSVYPLNACDVNITNWNQTSKNLDLQKLLWLLSL